ncbi:ATP synthase, F1 delta subunit [Saprospira grandis DSM 2844]|uniref:ATP synthase subunit delta n=1 Tax=Saprospira grandis DSM 2844 TaxID=694433 RepID=J1I3S3_9BACT|nr:ATP synthase F1 subunit delta [Saprospira grandis]EJF52983.1 ATP synthase, F1 delta subunit [Saprospira grandis DSM 2844]
MSISRIAARYAQSLFDLAQQEQALDQIHEDVKSIEQVVELPDFKAVMKNPLISTEKKENIFEAVFKGKIHPLALNTLMVMAEHKRERYLSAFCHFFHNLYTEYKEVSIVKLTTASTVGQATIDNILAGFQEKGLIKKDIELEVAVDSSLIAGFVLEFNDKVYNASVAQKLSELRTKFSQNLYTKNI